MDDELDRECRFYENTLPELNDLVVIQIKDVNENLFVVELLEYNRQEGVILLSDYTRSAKQSFGSLKLSKYKQRSVCQVIRIDREKKFIDLSKKNIDNSRRVEAEQRYEKGRKLQTFLYQFCDYFQMSMEDVYKMVVWPLARSHEDEDPYDLFHKAVFDFEGIFGDVEMPGEFRQKLEAEIKKRLTPQIVKIKALLEITCLDKEAIACIKTALLLCKSESTTEIPITVNLISPPSYLLEASTINKEKGSQAIMACLKKVEEYMKDKGIFKYKDYGDQKDIMEMAETKTTEDLGEEEDNNEGMGEADLLNDEYGAF